MGDALNYVELGTGRTVVALSLGFYHTCALLDNGKVKCWGDNRYGHLGLGDTANRGDATGEMGEALDYVDIEGTINSGSETRPIAATGPVRWARPSNT